MLLETHAQPPPDGQHPKVVVEGLAISAGVPAPRLVVVDDPAPYSFAVGRKPERAIVGLTTGLMQTATRDELEAALAYQISRVASLDVALSTWTVALTGRTIELHDRTERLSVKLALFVPVALARRLRRVAMRGQAEQRDELAVRFTRHPSALLSLPEKLHADQARVPGISRSSAPLWLEYHERDAAEVLPARIAVLRDLLAEPAEPASRRSLDTPASSAGP